MINFEIFRNKISFRTVFSTIRFCIVLNCFFYDKILFCFYLFFPQENFVSFRFAPVKFVLNTPLVSANFWCLMI